MSRSLCCCVFALWAWFPRLYAFPSFRFRVPNGNRVPCPKDFDGCSLGESLRNEPDSVCYGLGHRTCQGGTLPLNPWGAAWLRAGEWTEELCKADADGDGQSNGEELGDPCCLWKEGDEPSPYMAGFIPSHPGLASSKQPDSYVRPCCNGVDINVEPAVRVVDKAVFNPGEEQLSMEWRIKNFTVPSEHTVYGDFFFNFPDGDDPFFLVAGYAIVDKPLMLHHYTFEGCRDRVPESQEGIPTVRSLGIQCEINLGGFSGWAPGIREMFSMDRYTALPVGRAVGIASVKVNVHYTDGDKYPNTVTQDGIRLLYTRTARKHVQLSTPIMQIGSNAAMSVPAKKRRFFVTRTCTVKDICAKNDRTCRGFSKEAPLKVRASFYHAHLLGTEMYQTLYRKEDGCVTDLASQPVWYFDDQAAFPLESKKLTIAPGDVIQSTCVYNSMSRSADTIMGLSTYDEMCFANILTEHVAEGLSLEKVPYAFGCEEKGGNIWTGELGDDEDARELPYSHPLEEANDFFDPGFAGRGGAKKSGMQEELQAFTAFVEMFDGNNDCKLNQAEMMQAMETVDAETAQTMCLFGEVDCATGFTALEFLALLRGVKARTPEHPTIEEMEALVPTVAEMANIPHLQASYGSVAGNHIGAICNESWFPTPSGKCISAYKSVPNSANLAVDAAQACAALGGGAHLPIVRSESELKEFLIAAGLLMSVYKDIDIPQWVGLTRTHLTNQTAWTDQDGTGTEWSWADGTVVNETFWYQGEPNNELGNEGYVCMWASRKGFVWADLPPSGAGVCPNQFFCQTDAHRPEARQSSQIELDQLIGLTATEWRRRSATAAPSRCHVELPRPTAPPRQSRPNMCKVAVPRPKQAPSSCAAANVGVELLVSGVDYAQLIQSSSLAGAFKRKVQEAVANKAGNSIAAEHVSVKLSPGSVRVDAIITPPGGVSGDAVLSSLASQTDMAAAMVSALSSVQGIQSVMTGSSLSVSVVRVRAMPVPQDKAASAASELRPFSRVGLSSFAFVAATAAALSAPTR